MQYGNDIAPKAVCPAFHQNSIENTPAKWDSDPTFARVYKEAMMEVLAGDISGLKFSYCKGDRKVRELQPKGYVFWVFSSVDGQPQGGMDTTPNIQWLLPSSGLVIL